RNFIVLALGSLNNPLTLPVLNAALDDQDPTVRFNAVVSLGNMNVGSENNWDKIDALFQQEGDVGLKQVALLTMATHQFPSTEEKALVLLQSSEKNLRHAAAIVLIKYKKHMAKPVIDEIFNLRYDVGKAQELNG